MTADDYQEIVYQLLQRCRDLERQLTEAKLDVDGKNNLIDELGQQVADLTAGNEAGSLLISYDDETMDVDGHVVTMVSGGADYIGTFEEGFPRTLTLARYKNQNMQAEYFHESIVKELQQKLDSAKTNASLLGAALEDRF